MKLLIVSNMAHHRRDGRIVGWGPTVQEIDALAARFDSIEHVACLHDEPAPPNALPYRSPNVRLIPVAPTGGPRLRDKLRIVRELPRYARVIWRELGRADAVHVRCPANISMLAIVLLALARRPRLRWVKYAGNWWPAGREDWSYTFQRWWLARGLHRGVVTVNGRWPAQPGHVHSFHNPSLAPAEVVRACEAAERKAFAAPFSLLFVGRVEAAKGVGRLLRIAGELQARDVPFDLHIVGDGPERAAFEQQARAAGLSERVTFHGWLPRPALGEFYARAHFLVFPSASEGWPKVLSEAMAYGVVPIASAVSSIPQIFGETGAGVALPPDDARGFVAALLDYVEHPDRWARASRAGVSSARLFTYDHYLASVGRLFSQTWAVDLPKGEDELSHV